MSQELVQNFAECDEPGVRRRVVVEDDTKSYLDEQLAAILESRAVEHPFLNWYRTNSLTKDQERKLFLECFYFFKDLPFYIAAMAANTTSYDVLREIVFNVYDEVCGDVLHATLYRQFLYRIGITDADIESYECLPTTTALNLGIKKLYGEKPLTKALGALYADETMSAMMTAKLNDGLKNQGRSEDDRYFWILHTKVEIGHSNSVFNAVFPFVTEAAGRKVFEEGISEFLQQVEVFWDGVAESLGRTEKG